MTGAMWLEIWTDTVPAAQELENGTVAHGHVISSAEGIGVLGACTAVQCKSATDWIRVCPRWGFFSVITCIFFSLYFVWYSIRASTKLHESLLANILRAPMSFFDTTPSGRLTNRFGKDMNTVDNQIPGSISAVMHFLIVLVAFLIPIMYASPIFIPILCPLMVIYVFFQVGGSMLDIQLIFRAMAVFPL